MCSFTEKFGLESSQEEEQVKSIWQTAFGAAGKLPSARFFNVSGVVIL